MFNKKLSLLLLPFVAVASLQANDPFNDPFFNDPFGDDIFKEMMQMQHDMDRMFERMHQRIQKRSSGLVSPLGTYKMAVNNQFVDKGDHYELLTNIPESKENHIDINTANGLMSITAKIVQEQKSKTNNMISQSRSVRMYQQSMTLPQDADENSIKTEYKNGKLIVTISKEKIAKAKLMIPKTDIKKSEKKQIKNKVKSKDETNSTKKITINSDNPSMS